ncbi:MAG: restriction endonuclease subunit S [Leptolyngbya sp.]|nr:MAG: restriction endonuclease subunit S [Leptolyngbya sp.]
MSKYESQFSILSEVGTIARGKSKHRPRNDPSLYGGDYPFIQTGDVKHSSLYITEYSQTYNERGLAQSKLWKPGTLCITIAANIADTAILSFLACFPDSIIGFIPDPEKSDVRFIKYCLDTYKLQIQSISRGTTQDNLSVEKLLSIKLKLPPPPTQRKIAAVLSAYDDLIENNTRRIALLEKIAEEIYREWFVRLRFPGYEQVTFDEGIPEGWETIQLGNIVEDIIDYRGITPKKLNSDWQEEGISALSALNVKKGKLIRLEDTKRVSEALYEKWMRKKLDRLDVLITSEAPLGEVYILPEKAKYVLSQRLFAIRANPNKVEPFYLYYYLLCEMGQYELTSKATGSTVGGIRQALLKKVEILNPDLVLQQRFSSIVEPMLESIHKLWCRNNLLKQTRDRLLSRLISGKLSIEDLDIHFPPNMQDNTPEAQR